MKLVQMGVIYIELVDIREFIDKYNSFNLNHNIHNHFNTLSMRMLTLKAKQLCPAILQHNLFEGYHKMWLWNVTNTQYRYNQHQVKIKLRDLNPKAHIPINKGLQDGTLTVDALNTYIQQAYGYKVYDESVLYYTEGILDAENAFNDLYLLIDIHSGEYYDLTPFRIFIVMCTMVFAVIVNMGAKFDPIIVINALLVSILCIIYNDT